MCVHFIFRESILEDSEFYLECDISFSFSLSLFCMGSTHSRTKDVACKILVSWFQESSPYLMKCGEFNVVNSYLFEFPFVLRLSMGFDSYNMDE